MVAGALRVDVAAVTAARGGLLEVLKRDGRVHDAPAQVAAGIMYQMPLCVVPDLAPGLCNSDLVPPDTEKVSVSPEADETDPFGIYTAVECLPGLHDYQALALDALNVGASHGYEVALQALILDDVTDYVGSPVGIPKAIALAEEFLQGRAGYIITSRAGASYLSGYRGVIDKDFLLYTRQGTPIIGGSGIDGAAAGPTITIYVVGEFDLFVGPDIANRGYGPQTNVELAIAERAGSFSKPCFSGSIDVTVP
jgi:hypothetical protein